jgi:hypothetical protein
VREREKEKEKEREREREKEKEKEKEKIVKSDQNNSSLLLSYYYNYKTMNGQIIFITINYQEISHKWITFFGLEN